MKKILIVIALISHVLAYKEESLHYITDEVVGGSYKYYSLMYDGFIKIKLKSETGDADLYVSQTTTKPTYEPDHYCLQSSTCGEDSIIIPESFKRPVSVGIYGHPSHAISKYTLFVFNATNSKDTFDERNIEDNYDSYNDEGHSPSIVTSIAWYLLQLIFEVSF